MAWRIVPDRLACAPMALADEFDGLLVDLDGVVWIGRELLPGAVEALTSCSAAARRSSSSPTTRCTGRASTPSACAKRESPRADDRVLTGGAATAKLAAERAGPGGTAFVIGAPGFKETVAAAGLELLEGEAAQSADAVVVSGHRDFDYEELLTATRALQAGAALFATSRDPTLPMPGGPWPGTGAVLAAVETASGQARRDRRQARAAPLRAGAGADRRSRSGWRWSATASPPTSRAAGGPAWRRSSSSAAPPRARRPRRADPAPDHVIDDLPALLR